MGQVNGRPLEGNPYDTVASRPTRPAKEENDPFAAPPLSATLIPPRPRAATTTTSQRTGTTPIPSSTSSTPPTKAPTEITTTTTPRRPHTPKSRPSLPSFPSSSRSRTLVRKLSAKPKTSTSPPIYRSNSIKASGAEGPPGLPSSKALKTLGEDLKMFEALVEEAELRAGWGPGSRGGGGSGSRMMLSSSMDNISPVGTGFGGVGIRNKPNPIYQKPTIQDPSQFNGPPKTPKHQISKTFISSGVGTTQTGGIGSNTSLSGSITAESSADKASIKSGNGSIRSIRRQQEKEWKAKIAALSNIGWDTKKLSPKKEVRGPVPPRRRKNHSSGAVGVLGGLGGGSSCSRAGTPAAGSSSDHSHGVSAGYGNRGSRENTPEMILVPTITTTSLDAGTTTPLNEEEEEEKSPIRENIGRQKNALSFISSRSFETLGRYNPIRSVHPTPGSNHIGHNHHHSLQPLKSFDEISIRNRKVSVPRSVSSSFYFDSAMGGSTSRLGNGVGGGTRPSSFASGNLLNIPDHQEGGGSGNHTLRVEDDQRDGKRQTLSLGVFQGFGNQDFEISPSSVQLQLSQPTTPMEESREEEKLLDLNLNLDLGSGSGSTSEYLATTRRTSSTGLAVNIASSSSTGGSSSSPESSSSTSLSSGNRLPPSIRSNATSGTASSDRNLPPALMETPAKHAIIPLPLPAHQLPRRNSSVKASPGLKRSRASTPAILMSSTTSTPLSTPQKSNINNNKVSESSSMEYSHNRTKSIEFPKSLPNSVPNASTSFTPTMVTPRKPASTGTGAQDNLLTPNTPCSPTTAWILSTPAVDLSFSSSFTETPGRYASGISTSPTIHPFASLATMSSSPPPPTHTSSLPQGKAGNSQMLSGTFGSGFTNAHGIESGLENRRRRAPLQPSSSSSTSTSTATRGGGHSLDPMRFSPLLSPGFWTAPPTLTSTALPSTPNFVPTASSSSATATNTQLSINTANSTKTIQSMKSSNSSGSSKLKNTSREKQKQKDQFPSSFSASKAAFKDASRPRTPLGRTTHFGNHIIGAAKPNIIASGSGSSSVKKDIIGVVSGKNKGVKGGGGGEKGLRGASLTPGMDSGNRPPKSGMPISELEKWLAGTTISGK